MHHSLISLYIKILSRLKLAELLHTMESRNREASMVDENKVIFSIIIPVYNKEKYIASCLDSCLSQDLPADEYEIICVDDCGVDASGDILKRYKSTCGDRITLIRHEKNRGVSAARNTGIEKAAGKYVYFLDADDFMESNALSVAKALGATDPDTIQIGNYVMASDCFTPEEEEKRQRLRETGDADLLKNTLCLIGCYFYRRSILMEQGIRFREDISYAEDAVFRYEYRAFEKALVETSEILHYYRTVPGSLLHRPKAAKISSYIALVKAYKEFLERRAADSAKMEYLLYLRIRDCVDATVRYPLREQRKYIHALKELGVLGKKAPPEAVRYFQTRMAAGVGDTTDLSVRSYRLAATPMGFAYMFLRVYGRKLVRRLKPC